MKGGCGRGGRGLPRYVVNAFARYLACGDFSRAFVRCHGGACAHDVLLPFSCKRLHGVCPSCCARRMCNEAACITDRILPNAPVRQWVLSLPFELRGLAATQPDVLTALGRIFAEEIARATRRLAGVADAETGAISFPQRLGGSLNLHVHFHTLATDGVFEKVGDGVRAAPLPLAPARDPTGQTEFDFDAAWPTARRPSPRTRTLSPGRRECNATSRCTVPPAPSLCPSRR